MRKFMVGSIVVMLALPGGNPVRAGEARPEPVTPPPRNELTVSVEPVAGGLQYLRALGTRWHVGTALTVGPLYGVPLAGSGERDLREWATAGPVLACRTPAGLRVFLSPIGAALAVGDDYGAVYPSAQAGLELVRGRWRLGSAVRGIRIAQGDGKGKYWVRWVAGRLGYALTW